MTKQDEEKIKELEDEIRKHLEEKFRAVRYKGVVDGFKAAFNTVVEMIDNGMSLEDIKKWAKSEEEKAEIVEEVTLSNKSE